MIELYLSKVTESSETETAGKMYAKLAWTDKTKAEIAAAKGDNGNVNGNGNDNANPNPNANPNVNPNPNQGGGGDSGSIVDGTDEG